jgi:hypothetical protein
MSAEDCHAAGAGGIGGRETGIDFGDYAREGRRRCPRNQLTNGIREASMAVRQHRPMLGVERGTVDHRAKSPAAGGLRTMNWR